MAFGILVSTALGARAVGWEEAQRSTGCWAVVSQPVPKPPNLSGGVSIPPTPTDSTQAYAC